MILEAEQNMFWVKEAELEEVTESMCDW